MTLVKIAARITDTIERHHFYADGDATDLTLCLVGLGVVAAILIAIGIGSGAY